VTVSTVERPTLLVRIVMEILVVFDPLFTRLFTLVTGVVVLHPGVALTVFLGLGRLDRNRTGAGRQVVEKEALTLVGRYRRATGAEQHRLNDTRELLGGRFGVVQVVVLPAGALMNLVAIDPHFDDIVGWSVDGVQGEFDSVRLLAIEAGSDL